MRWPFDRRRGGQKRGASLNRRQQRQFLLEPIEPRILLNADPVEGLLPMAVLSSDLHPATVRDSDGTQIRIELDGRGHWSLTQGANGPELSVTVANSDTAVSIKTSGGDGRFRLGGITLSGPVEQLRGRSVDLDGSLTADRRLERLELGSVRGRVEAPAIERLTVHGDFNADLNLTGQGAKGRTLEKATIDGALLGGHWTVVGGAETIEAARIGADWDASFTGQAERIKTDGNFDGQIAAPSLEHLDVGGNLDGARLLIGAEPESDADLVEPVAVVPGEAEPAEVEPVWVKRTEVEPDRDRDRRPEVERAEVEPVEVEAEEVEPVRVRGTEVERDRDRRREVEPPAIEPNEVEPAEIEPVRIRRPEVERAEVEPVEVEPVEVESAEVEPVPVILNDVGPVEVESTDVEPIRVRRTEIEPVRVRWHEVEGAEVERREVEPADVEPVRVRRHKGERDEIEPAENEQTEVEPVPVTPIEVEPVEVEAVEVDPAEVEPVRVRRRDEVEPAENEPTEVEPVPGEVNEVEPVEVEPAEVEPVPGAVDEAEPVEVEPETVVPVVDEPTEVDPVPVAPNDAEPVEAAPVEVEPVAVAPVEVELIEVVQQTQPIGALSPLLTVALKSDKGSSAPDGLTSAPIFAGTLAGSGGIASFLGGLDATGPASFTSLLSALNPDGTFELSLAMLTQLAGGMLANGTHTLHLVALDNAGNTTTLDVAFVLDPEPDVS